MITRISQIRNKLYCLLKNYHPTKYLGFLYFIIPIFIAVCMISKMDNDFWFLLNTGKYIVHNGFPTIEPFTIHNNLSFIIQQWLTDCIYYFIHCFSGCWGIFIFTIMQFLLIIFITYKLCLLVSDNRNNLSIIITVFISSLLALFFVRSRPQMFDYIILVSVIYCLELYIRKKQEKYLLFLPLLSLLMINLHCSSWWMMFAFMVPYLINSFKFKLFCFESEGYEKKWLFIALILMLVVGIINPYGIDAITYLFKSYGNTYIDNLVAEMKEPSIRNFYGIIIYLTILSVLFFFAYNSAKKLKIRYFLLFLGTTYLSFKSVKGFSFFVISSIFPLCYTLKQSFLVDNNYNHSFKFKLIYVLFLIFIMALVLIYPILTNVNFYNTDTSKVITYLEKNEKIDKNKVKVYTSYNNGSYAEYKGIKVYLDPRAEVFLKKNNKKKDILVEYYKLQSRQIDIDKFLETYDFDYLIVNQNDVLYKYYLTKKNNKKYKKIYVDNDTKTYLFKKIFKSS